MSDIIKHEKTLEELLKKVSDKNRELYQLNQEQESLSSNIHSLKMTVISLNDEIKTINKIIDDKRREAETDFHAVVRSQEAKYQEMLAEFKKKDDDLSKRELALIEDTNKNQLRLFEIKSREDAIIKRNRELDAVSLNNEAREKEIERLDAGLKIKYDEFNAYCAKKNAEMLQAENTLNNQRSGFDAFVKEVNEEVDKANKILSRINEANAILLKAQEKEASIKERETKTNELHVKALAEMRRVSVSIDALKVKERELAKREENIKLAEATIAKE